MPGLKRLLANAAALKDRDLLRENTALLQELKSEKEPDLSQVLSLLSGDNRIWLYTLRKSGTTFTLNVLLNYIVEMGQRRDCLPQDIPLRLSASHALAPELLRTFHSIDGKVGRKSLGQNLDTQRRILLPTWGVESLVHTHRPIPQPHFRHVIGLQRNPFDFAVSSYHFHVKSRGRDMSFSEALLGRLKSFVKHDKTLRKLKKNPNCIVIAYESLMRTPKKEFHRLFSFLGQSCQDDILALALERSSKETVRKMEQRTGRVLVGNVKELQCESFIRSGKVGEWRELFSTRDERDATAYLESQGVDLSQYTFD